MVDVDFDILIVGSGPSGVMAAEGCLPTGLRVAMMDVGHVSTLPLAPELPFKTLREHDEVQNILQQAEQTKNVIETGAHLTPFRRHAIEKSAWHLPIQSADFSPLQSVAKGGLGVAWGAATFTYTGMELKKMGLSEDLQPYYDRVAEKIGVSGPQTSVICAIRQKQLPLKIDDNARTILKCYEKKLSWFQNQGLQLESASLAALSQSMDDRESHAYHDTDFWNNPGRSVFRSDFWIDRLIQNHENFHYFPQRLVQRFDAERPGLVRLVYTDLKTGKICTLSVRKIYLCAGAINSYRLAAISQDHFFHKNPLLCNPYRLVSCMNIGMLGKMGTDKRHSLAQLFGLFSPDRASTDPVSLQFYSYRSLFLYRLIAQTPLPVFAARLWWRALVESLVIVGVHYPAEMTPYTRLQLTKSTATPCQYRLPSLSIEHQKTAFPRSMGLLYVLAKLGCLPLGIVNNEPGASIHYAGTLPMVSRGEGIPGFPNALTTRAQDAALSTCPDVHVLDASPWRFLPAKGLTFSLMANSLRLSENIAMALKERRYLS